MWTQSKVTPSLLCVHMHYLRWSSECRIIPVKCFCALFCAFIAKTPSIFAKHFLFLFLFLYYTYFGAYPFHLVSTWHFIFRCFVKSYTYSRNRLLQSLGISIGKDSKNEIMWQQEWAWASFYLLRRLRVCSKYEIDCITDVPRRFQHGRESSRTLFYYLITVIRELHPTQQ